LGASPEADLQNSRNRLSAFDSFHRASQIGALSLYPGLLTKRRMRCALRPAEPFDIVICSGSASFCVFLTRSICRGESAILPVGVCLWSNLMISDFGIAGGIYLLTGFPG
jgi:hypothetical protein